MIPLRTRHLSTSFKKTLPLLTLAGVISLFKIYVPYGELVLYPFTLFATWVHEMGHGLTALTLGGKFSSLRVDADASGLALIGVVPGWRMGLASAAGPLFPPFIGALLLYLTSKWNPPHRILKILSAIMFVSLLLWVRNVTGWISIGALASIMWALSAKTPTAWCRAICYFLSIFLALDSMFRVGYLFSYTALTRSGVYSSDVTQVALNMGGPVLFWGIVLFLISLAFLIVGLKSI